MEIEILSLNMLRGRKASGSEQRTRIINTFTANRFDIFTFIDGYSRLAVQVRKLVSEVAREAEKSQLLFNVHYACFFLIFVP